MTTKWAEADDPDIVAREAEAAELHDMESLFNDVFAALEQHRARIAALEDRAASLGAKPSEVTWGHVTMARRRGRLEGQIELLEYARIRSLVAEDGLGFTQQVIDVWLDERRAELETLAP